MSWLEPTIERYAAQQAVTNEIDKRLDSLRKSFCGRSEHRGILENQDFVALVSMGDRIVNYLLHRMTNGGFRHEEYILLKQLTGNKIPELPQEHKGRVPYIMAHTLFWWVGSEYYKADNIYYGLVE